MLIFAGKIMNKNQTLTEYGIEDKFCIHAIMKKKNSNVQRNEEQEDRINQVDGKVT